MRSVCRSATNFAYLPWGTHAGWMDKTFWESHWRGREPRTGAELLAHPYLERETSTLAPGTALDAGCGEGAEAVWLASRGWSVTAADISPEALARAASRVAQAGLAARVRFVEADLSGWEPQSRFDLVTTHYAHPATSQVAFYERISRWVAPGGTLLVVGHLRTPNTPPGHGHGHDDGQPPDEATVSAASVTAVLDPELWEIVTATEQTRTVARPHGAATELHDVVVRATRRR
jgi:SAM-dependent methyltransferase